MKKKGDRVRDRQAKAKTACYQKVFGKINKQDKETPARAAKLVGRWSPLKLHSLCIVLLHTYLAFITMKIKCPLEGQNEDRELRSY